jgi:hypothetical protein
MCHFDIFFASIFLYLLYPDQNQGPSICSMFHQYYFSIWSPEYFLNIQIEPFGIILFMDSPITLQANKSRDGL